LVRSAKSDASKALGSLPNVELIEGKYEDIPAIFGAAGSLWGLFLVLAVGGDEVKWGKTFVDEAKKAGVQHVVYSGVDRRGLEKTPVEHVSKRKRKFNSL